MSSSVDSVKEIINSIAKKEVVYIVGLWTFLNSSSDQSFNNFLYTLEAAFGRKFNYLFKVYQEVEKAFDGIDLYAYIKVNDEEIMLRNYLMRYIENVSQMIIEEIKNRFNQMPEEDKRILSVACAVIQTIKNRRYPGLRVEKNNNDLLEISSTDKENFSSVVSSVLGLENVGVRGLFCKYFLGFLSDSRSHQHYTYTLTIYPFAEIYIEKLAVEASKYIKIFNKSEIQSRLKELYYKEDFLTLSMIEWALYTVRIEPLFLISFFGIPYEQLIEVIKIEGIINKGFINPLVYDYVKEAMNVLYDEALKELMDLFKSIFENKKYTSVCVRECCTFTQPVEESIYICFLPWPKKKDTYLREAKEIRIKAVVVQGIPTGTFFQYLERYEANKGFAWFFLDKRNKKIVIPFNIRKKETYAEIYHKLEQMLNKYFTIE
jgi:hypothetical protein